MGYTFVLGGARSGKSSYAEQVTAKLAHEHALPVTYLATSQVTDQEMAERIARHKRQRSSEWKTAEVPMDVADWLRNSKVPQVVLVDCLSLLLNNWMFYENSTSEEAAKGTDDYFFNRMNDLVDACKNFPYPLVIVSNEVGQGLVPPDPISRQYRDWLGLLNQAIAKDAEFVYYLVAGIPMDVRKFSCK